MQRIAKIAPAFPAADPDATQVSLFANSRGLGRQNCSNVLIEQYICSKRSAYTPTFSLTFRNPSNSKVNIYDENEALQKGNRQNPAVKM
jgi:hypothetical protein